MNDTKVKLTPEEADSLMPKGRDVHTFSNPAGMLLGCDQSRKSLIALFTKNAPELAGPSATKMGHGIVVLDDGHPLFVATDAAALKAFEESH